MRQDRARGLTMFDETFVERRDGRARRRRFSLTFRTLPMPRDRSPARRDAGFRVDATLGDYQGGPWDPRAQVWLLLARRT